MKEPSVSVPCVLAAAAMLFVLGGASVARAQQQPEVVAHVPFSFVVGTAVLPAGNYIVKADANDDAVVAVVSEDGKQFADTLTIPSSPLDNLQSGAQLVFKTVGGQHFLASVAPADGNARDVLLTPARIERGIEAADSLNR